MKRAIDILKANSYGEPGAWKRKAQEELDAWDWKQYSYTIAIKVRQKMTRNGITQKKLAEKMGCTQQYISLLLKGNLNLTLETIARLEKALQFSLIGGLLNLDQNIATNPVLYLSEAPGPGYGGDDRD